MAADAIAGRNQDAVDWELAAFRKTFATKPISADDYERNDGAREIMQAIDPVIPHSGVAIHADEAISEDLQDAVLAVLAQPRSQCRSWRLLRTANFSRERIRYRTVWFRPPCGNDFRFAPLSRSFKLPCNSLKVDSPLRREADTARRGAIYQRTPVISGLRPLLQ
ncbi:hypothetical protein [Pararhizobium sp. PWRC1-1]|uniref:hypothetical protein n=1 Tax=Pararhizobium sp. PWRC1-1 TaxID=2804566 RepID=UPI003CEAF77B